ncbi:MAG: RING finger protein [Barrevirus sp.]|uniref:RING finger protein n=1 Tax=Barrevirus sp. TaxID=2487763 RepID=A0A3G4ZPZ1_9VIRU|nr:MAG: RING finger protein [Barrevirus sp.]
MDKDNDVRYAIRLRAHEYGIFDEDLIERLFCEFEKKQYEDISDIINETFIDYQEDIGEEGYIEPSETGSLSHDLTISDLESTRYFDSANSLNVGQQDALRTEYNNRYPPMLPQNMYQVNPFAQLFGNFPPLQADNFVNPFTSVKVTMTKDALSQIKDLTYDELIEILPNLDPLEKCAICWEKLSEPIDDLKFYKVLNCNHCFHSVCITEELENYSYHCPTCKTECGDHEVKAGDDGYIDPEYVFELNNEEGGWEEEEIYNFCQCSECMSLNDLA